MRPNYSASSFIEPTAKRALRAPLQVAKLKLPTCTWLLSACPETEKVGLASYGK